jgi:hypothetical protein
LVVLDFPATPRREVAEKELFVPFVEAWYPADIPLGLITDGLMVRIQADS